MSDQLPIVEVPESTWLRALAHALDPEAETPDESLVPEDDPVSDALEDDVVDVDDDDDDVDDAPVSFDDADQHDWNSGDTWSPDDGADAGDLPHHDDDGIG